MLSSQGFVVILDYLCKKYKLDIEIFYEKDKQKDMLSTLNKLWNAKQYPEAEQSLDELKSEFKDIFMTVFASYVISIICGWMP